MVEHSDCERAKRYLLAHATEESDDLRRDFVHTQFLGPFDVNAVPNAWFREVFRRYRNYFSKIFPEWRDYYHVTPFLGRPNQPAARGWGRLETFMRQSVEVLMKVSRGKSLSKYR